MAITAFSNLLITISDGGTSPSLDYLSNKTYVDIGSGNILKVSWNTPSAANNMVDSYKVYILSYDKASDEYKQLYSCNVGNVNEFYLKSSMFRDISQVLIQLKIYVEAISYYGAAYNGISNTKLVDVARGSGTYSMVADGYQQPIMKRALAFAKLNYLALVDEAGEPVAGLDGKQLYIKATPVQDIVTGWSLMQEFYAKSSRAFALYDTTGRAIVDANDRAIYIDAKEWQLSDIAYEVLTDSNGELITDENNENIYIL